jgi:hypothetical protein
MFKNQKIFGNIQYLYKVYMLYGEVSKFSISIIIIRVNVLISLWPYVLDLGYIEIVYCVSSMYKLVRVCNF